MGSATAPGLLDPLIRPAAAIEAQAVNPLLGELGYPCDEADAARRIQALADDDNPRLLVAEVHGGLISYELMYYGPLGAITCRITARTISDAARRRGLGRALLCAAEARARAAGAAQLERTTARHRLDANAFHRTCGYQETSLRLMKRLGDA
jgi:GNAT superfamily N-acetyltransferase